MGRKIVFVPSEFYHLYNRGVEKRNIFLNEKDYDRFLSLLYLCNATEPVHLQHRGSTFTEAAQVSRKDTLIDIASYCLMPNHFHLLVREKEEGNISRFMQKLATGYTMYFNTKRERSGSLFEGTFKARHVDDDRYLKYVIAYINLNPIKLIEPSWKETGIKDRKKAEKFLEHYRYSSYLDHLQQGRVEKCIINPEVLLEYEDLHNFKESVTEWLSYNHPLQG